MNMGINHHTKKVNEAFAAFTVTPNFFGNLNIIFKISVVNNYVILTLFISIEFS